MKLLLFTFVAILAHSAWAAPIKLASQDGSVEFLAVTKPSFIKIKGTGNAATTGVTIEAEKINGTFEFVLSTLTTGIGGRDDHMKNKYLQVDKYPNAKLEISDLKLPGPYKAGETIVKEGSFSGKMNLHGETKPVDGKYTLDKDGSVVATFRVQLSNFKIEAPAFMGMTVKDDIDVTVNIAQLKEVK